jgi:uncharacterized protein (TIGR02300 family)
MSTVHDRRKALRGTKRTCQACEIRFYDLGRNPIVCPMCGADYTPPAEPAVATRARAAPFTKTGWHRQPLKRLLPVLPVEAMPSSRFATAAADEQTEEAEAPTVDTDEDSGVLKQQDDTDVAGLVEHVNDDEKEPR